MVSSTRQAIACILVIFSAVVFARAQIVQPKEPTATITGKVTIKGKAAPGIFIGLQRQGSSYPRQLTGLRATTDSEGKYRIENVAPGSYVVIPVAPAYLPDEQVSERVLIINKGETIENVDFVLLRGGAITGRVVDAEGRPLVEEEVVALPEPQNMRAHSRHLSARTDDRGIYRLFGLPPGRYKVAAGNESFSRYHRNSYKRTYHPGVEDVAHAGLIEVSEGSETTSIDLTLGRPITTYTASGRIVDGQTGQPMPNIAYSLTYYHDEHSSSSSSGAFSNSRGEFRLENLSPGKYGVSIQNRTSELRADELRFEVMDQDIAGLVIKTERGASVSGVIVVEGPDDKSTREQLSRAHVGAYLLEDGARRGYGAAASPAPDGSFRIPGLASGTATIQVYSSTAHFRVVRVERNGVIQPRGIEVKPGEQITGVRVVAAYGNANIRGVITVEKGTLPPNGRFYVWLRTVSDDPAAPNTWTDATQQTDSRGHFAIDNLFAGTYELTVGVAVEVSPGRTQMLPSKKQEVVITAGSHNNVTIPLDLSSTTTPRP